MTDPHYAALERYLQGWNCGAGFLSIPSELSEDKDFLCGWKDGRTAKKKAIVKAERAYAVKLRVVKLCW